MSRRRIELSLTELAGSMGDFGTLLPLAIGYIVACKLDPAGFLVMMGVANIVTGLVYRLPMPIEPMKALAVIAIAQHWSPSLVYASGIGMGIAWILLATTGLISWIARVTPTVVVFGIQVTLGLLLSVEALRFASDSWALALAGVAVVLLLRDNKRFPAAIVLVGGGLAIMSFTGGFSGLATPQLQLPEIVSFKPEQVWTALLLGGFAQIPLTAGNAVIATSSVIKSYWPEEDVPPRKLAFSHGIMNLVAPWFGAMPMCHGAGGLVGQYFYGARTAGANLIEGAIEIVLGLFFAGSISTLFAAFPRAIVGAMMFMVGLQLVKFALRVRAGREIAVLATTVGVALLSNMAFGYLVGIVIHYVVDRMRGFRLKDG